MKTRELFQQLITQKLKPNNYIFIDDITNKQTDLLVQYGKNITTLCITNLTRKTLPNNLFTLTNLTKLKIHGNLHKISPKISDLINLKELVLSQTYLQQIPNTITELINLESLDLSCNELETLPKSLKTLTQLKYLDLSHNKITKFTIEDFPPNLETLYLHYCPITNLPKEIFNQFKTTGIDIKMLRKYYESQNNTQIN